MSWCRALSFIYLVSQWQGVEDRLKVAGVIEVMVLPFLNCVTYGKLFHVPVCPFTSVCRVKTGVPLGHALGKRVQSSGAQLCALWERLRCWRAQSPLMY